MSMLLLTQSDSVISERLTSALADVESRFAAELLSELSCVNNLVTHVEQYRGKMLRPTLVLLSAMANDPSRTDVDEAHRVVATVTEMVHMATLVHDDILDEAEMRRRGATINSLCGNEAAVMLGDYLISHAYHLCSSLDQPYINRIIAGATNKVCEGELLQLANRNNRKLDEGTYFEIIRRKTASLCGTCCQLPAIIDNAEPARGHALYEYGEKLGVAFQIVDDLLDLTGDQQTVGKTLGRDLEKGKLTLPLIRYLATSDPACAERMRTTLRAQGEVDTPEVQRLHDLEWIREQLTASDAVDYARQRASRLVEGAKSSIAAHLPASPARSLLLGMADAVLSREY